VSGLLRISHARNADGPSLAFAAADGCPAPMLVPSGRSAAADPTYVLGDRRRESRPAEK
jgi:hypothetical protein